LGVLLLREGRGGEKRKTGERKGKKGRDREGMINWGREGKGREKETRPPIKISGCATGNLLASLTHHPPHGPGPPVQ